MTLTGGLVDRLVRLTKQKENEVPKYDVVIPCTMVVLVRVEAENEEAARVAAFDVDFCVVIESTNAAEPKITEFEAHEQVAYGNAYCGCICDMEVTEVDA